MPELWLRKIFPAVVIANTNILEKGFRIFLDQRKIKDLPENSTDILKKTWLISMVDKCSKQMWLNRCVMLEFRDITI